MSYQDTVHNNARLDTSFINECNNINKSLNLYIII